MKKIITLILMMFTLVFASACSCDKNKEPTNRDYSKAFSVLANKIYVKEEEPTVKALAYVDSSQSDDHNYYAVGAYVIFLREAFKNKNFDVVGKGVVYYTSLAKFTIEGQTAQMPMNVNFKMDYVDEEIKVDLYFNENNEEMHMIIDMKYDFEKEELKSYDLYLKSKFNGNINMLSHYKGVGDTISILEDIEDDDYAAVLSFFETRYNSLSSGLDNPKNIGDYSLEYTTAMVEQANFIYGEGTATPALD